MEFGDWILPVVMYGVGGLALAFVAVLNVVSPLRVPPRPPEPLPGAEWGEPAPVEALPVPGAPTYVEQSTAIDRVGSRSSSEARVHPEVDARKTQTSTAVRAEAKFDKKSWTVRLREGLSRTHGQIVRNLDEMFLSKESKATREDTLEKLFELLIQADVGVRTSEHLVDRVRSELRHEEVLTPETIKTVLRREALALLATAARGPASQGTLEAPRVTPHVVMMVGVNGVGKTTTTGKLAFKCAERGQSVVIGAADTFRAAAVEQLAVWADRAKATLVRLKEGTDPASVAFEAVRLGKQNAAHICIVDTAGRLHNRNDLMQELAKIKRVMAKESETAPHEVLLVLDATTGQNALMQARTFKEVVDITGLVITKLDGTAKGGVAIAVAHELQLPIRYVGVGESVDDLEVFSPDEFVNALFAT